jgi:hypothetical protein
MSSSSLLRKSHVAVAHRLHTSHAAGDALALAGVELGLVVGPINLPPVVL